MTDKWNFPAELPEDKRTSGGEFSGVLALFSAPNFREKGKERQIYMFFPRLSNVIIHENL